MNIAVICAIANCTTITYMDICIANELIKKNRKSSSMNID